MIPFINCMLMVIDVQQKLIPAIENGAEVIANTNRLLTAANILNIPIVATEQNSKGLGPTVPELLLGQAEVFEKLTFNALENMELANILGADVSVVVAGCESHVCVLQSVLGLLQRAIPVFVVEDAIGSRSVANRAAALRRMSAHGAEVVTTEMVLFEWIKSSQHPKFKEILGLVR
jgi:nicotinamidase-related amidase